MPKRYFLACYLLLCPLVAFADQPVSVQLQGVSQALVERLGSGLEPHNIASNSTFEETVTQLQAELRQRLHTLGYYQAQVTSRVISHHPAAVSFNITLKEPVRVKSVQLTLEGDGKSDPLLRYVNNLYLLHTQEVFVHSVHESSKRLLITFLTQQGYADAHFTTHQVLVNKGLTEATVLLTLETGPKFYLSSATFPAIALQEPLLYQMLPYPLPRPYSPQAMLDFESRLNDSGYFSKALVTPTFMREDQQANVALETALILKPQHHYTSGLGYGTDTGVRGRLTYENRYLNRYGHRLILEGFASQIKTEAQAVYKVPGSDPVTDHWNYKLRYTQEDVGDKQWSRNEIGIASERQIKLLEQRIFLDLRQENFRAFDTAKAEHQTRLVPGVHWIYLERDNPRQPRLGWQVDWLTQASVDLRIKAHSFLQSTLRIKRLSPISENWTAAARMEVGALWVDDFARVPVDYRYYAGGDKRIRGFAYQSLGPVAIGNDGQPHVIGGRYLGVLGTEWIYDWTPQFANSFFVEGGNAFMQDPKPLALSVGTGLRWKTGLGPIRVDFAFPLTEAKKDFRLHINFGGDL